MKNLYSIIFRSLSGEGSTQNKSQIEPTKVQIPKSRKETVVLNTSTSSETLVKRLHPELCRGVNSTFYLLISLFGMGNAWGQITPAIPATYSGTFSNPFGGNTTAYSLFSI